MSIIKLFLIGQITIEIIKIFFQNLRAKYLSYEISFYVRFLI
jgi:hypothetical protein